MKKQLLITGFLLCALSGVSLAENDIDRTAKMALGQPFWSNKLMENEPVLFIQEEGKAAAVGKLLFVPGTKPVITHPDLVMKYEEGKDYTWNPGTDTIELTPNSRIPFKTSLQMRPPGGGPNTLCGVLWTESHYFHDLQVQVTYEHPDDWTWQPTPPSQLLVRSLRKLNAKDAFKIVALGDSITAGFNASGFKNVWAPPYQPCYAQLVANTLQQRFGASTSLLNLGIAGVQASMGFNQIKQVKEAHPDLVMIAYGMNHREPGTAFKETIAKLLAAVQAAAPNADIVLVSPMTQAPSQGKVADKFFAYRDALRSLVGANVAFADVTTPFAELLKKKPFSDLSGNNINHPNDFTHRLYAQVICQLFPLNPTIK